MIWAGSAALTGLPSLVWSADRFVDGPALTAPYFGMPIVGFGTSAPEMVVSAISVAQGNPRPLSDYNAVRRRVKAGNNLSYFLHFLAKTYSD